MPAAHPIQHRVPAGTLPRHQIRRLVDAITEQIILAEPQNRIDHRFAIGRDAVERYQVLRKQLDAFEAKVNAVLGPERTQIVP